jgi:universal stress protein E
VAQQEEDIMHTLRQILVGVDLHHGDRLASPDLGDEVHAAVHQAAELAKAHQAQITLCAVLEISEQAHELIRKDAENVLRTVEDAASEVLEHLAHRLGGQGLTVKTVVRFGHAWQELLQEIQDGRHELLVVGTRRRSGPVRFLFGSTAQHLIRACPVPVWVVKEGEVRPLKEVAVASDFSDAAQAAVHAGVGLANATKSKLFVLHALEFPFEAYLRTAGVSDQEVQSYRERLTDEAQRNLRSQLAQTDARTLASGAQVHVVEGPADEVVPRFIDEHEVDVLVVGTYGRWGLSGLILGNTAERLLPVVHCSLLAVKPQGFVSPVPLESAPA